MRKVIIKDQREQVEILFHSSAVEIRLYRVGQTEVKILPTPNSMIAFESLKAIDKDQAFIFKMEGLVIEASGRNISYACPTISTSYFGNSIEIIEE